ncbi:hydroxylamine reductase [Alkaliphilus pronyensis]|uniref:Hydroxylamine reductase n=2 Tax=Alkaliphilus pronyensis TaxID=1482732 RepID=A0A6I0F0V7_9FIRM|nr:hydroxylamine reductase [Alkaliphilus pronyensis]
MFCHQCQEAAKNTGCTVRGVCGKTSDVSNLQDLLIYVLKGLATYNLEAKRLKINSIKVDRFITQSLFTTITNANFDKNVFTATINEALLLRQEVKTAILNSGGRVNHIDNDSTTWFSSSEAEFQQKAKEVGFLSIENEDVRSLISLITFGLKGLAAYTEHAFNLGYEDEEIYSFMQQALVDTLDNSKTADDLVALNLKAGEVGVKAMALLDKANTSTYGHPEITRVNIGVRKSPAILISGHDLKDMEELLKQTEGTGVDVYTHSEMLPANYYPAFKRYSHFVGNYGNAWWKQDKEFESFNGPILMTTNCLVPPKESYKDRVYTTGAVGFEGLTHIPLKEDGSKDFSKIIEHAKKCKPPIEIEKGEIIGGFAHNTVLSLADKVVEAVKSGAIKQFFVMAGCDGRMKSRDYYTDFAKALPKDTVILTAGCAKYKYNKLDLGDIGGIPRVLDAGQCNDSYSLAVIALKLKEVFELNDINELPISYNIAWYEQKAVIVLLALLHLGVKNIHLGPTLPAFLSPNVVKVLVENFGIGGITNVEADVKMFLE